MSAGAPVGNNNATKTKPWAKAIEWALENYKENSIKKGLALRAIATKLVEKAIVGDKDSIQEIGNRLDGKPKQQTELTGSDDSNLVIQIVRYGNTDTS